MSKHRKLTAAGAGLASLAFACVEKPATPPSLDDEVQELVKRSEDANRALLRGDVDRYRELVELAGDFTLMSPFGGKPTRGGDPKRLEPMRSFFKNGVLEQEFVHAYASTDLVVLATIERGRVEVGGLPAQDWSLRVTLVYRRDAGGWRLAHRHADPLAHGISLGTAATLARGDAT